MSVIRNIDKSKYAVDGGGSPVDATKLSKELSFVQRVYPIDKYDIPSTLVTSPRVGRMRILKVPLLGQGGYKGNWCGRTSMSMAYNWFQLLTEADPKEKYITHWNAGHAGWLLNLRFPSGIRAFTSPEETAESNSYDHGYGRFVDTVNKAFSGKTYEEHALDTYVAADSAQRAARLGKLDEEGVQKLFEVVVRSIEKNNPVFMYSGLTNGCNHLILLCGFVFIAEGNDEHLWIAVADPATESWIASFPGPDGKEVENTLDLTKKGATLEGLSPSHNLINLVTGEWNERRATLSLVRASFFVRGKGEFGAFTKAKDSEEFKKYAAANALVMDDVGNPHPGGAIFSSVDTVHLKTPDDAVVAREPRCVFPLEIEGISSCPIPALFRQEDRDVEAGGAYPLGAYDNLHGGVHFPTPAGGGDGVPVYAMAPGTIVAARVLLSKAETAGEEKDRLKRAALARELAGNSPDFVLVRHEMEIASDAKGPKETFVFHCLYMHLAAPKWSAGDVGDSAWARVPWLSALLRERKGTITVVDPDPQLLALGDQPRFMLGKSAITPAVGDHFWPADDCKDGELAEGTLRVFLLESNAIVDLVIAPRADGRIAVVTKKPEGEVTKALDALGKGELVTFPEAHRNLVVDAGTLVGFASGSSEKGAGFMHWEVLSPGDGGSGVKKLLQLAAKHELDIFQTFAESDGSRNNLLDPKEEDALIALLPAEDRESGDDKHVRDLRTLSFAESADGSKLTKDHYHLRIDARNFEDVLPAGTRDVRLVFSGGGRTETMVAPLTVAKGEKAKTVEVPAWASEVEVESTGIMVREFDRRIEPGDLNAHMTRIAKHRWRNVSMRHLNEWSEADMLAVVEARFKKADQLKELVAALCWWGEAETPLYSEKKLFGDVLPKSTPIDNIHPVVAVWLINVLLERRVAYFKNPKSEARRVKDAKAMFAGWLPATPKRAPLAAGEEVSVVAVSNCPYDADLRIKVVAKGPAKCQVVLGVGQYRSDTYLAGGPLSAWGEVGLEITHTAGGVEKKESPKWLGGESKVVLAKPLLAPNVGGPTIGAGGIGTWDFAFTDDCPRRLLGYVVAEARVKAPEGQAASAWKLCKAALPITAERLPLEAGGPVYERGFLVKGPTGKKAPSTKLASGIEWREIEAARDPEHELRVSQKLLGLLGRLDAAYATKTAGDMQLVKKSLGKDGCAIGVVATATKPPKGQPKTAGKSVAENNAALITCAEGVGLAAASFPEGASEPQHVIVSIAHHEDDDLPGGVLRTTFDPKTLYGAVLTEMNPGPKEVVEVSLACHFFNGGHLLRHQNASEADFETGEASRPDVIEGADIAGFVDDAIIVRTERVDASVSLPRIENVGVELGNFGINLTAELVGGDDRFWKAAAPVFEVGGKQVAGTLRGGAGKGAHRMLNAHYYFTSKEPSISGVVTVKAMTTKAAGFEKVELAAGKIAWEAGDSPFASYDTTARIDKVEVTPHPTPKPQRIIVTVRTNGIPPPVDLEIVIAPESDPSQERLAGSLVTQVFQTSAGRRLTTGTDGVALAYLTVDKLVKKLGSGPFMITVRRHQKPNAEPGLAASVMGTAKWPAQ